MKGAYFSRGFVFRYWLRIPETGSNYWNVGTKAKASLADMSRKPNIEWTEQMNKDILECKRKTMELTPKQNPPVTAMAEERVTLKSRKNYGMRRVIQLFRESLSRIKCTRQSRKVIWDMINTLFLTTVAVEPTFVTFLQHSQTYISGLPYDSFKFLWKTVHLKSPTQDCRVHFFRQPFSK